MERKLFIDHGGATAEGKFAELPDKIRNDMPQKEPVYNPALGVVYRVLEPYYKKECIDDVNEAMRLGEISSGTRWPRKMAENICSLYRVPVAIPTSSGASALHVALLSLSVYQCEVIVPTFTMVAVANAVKLAGGLVVYADSQKDNINPGLAEIEKVASVRTKAVIICHTYGIAADDIGEIAEWCRAKNIFLIEDICECMGTRLGERSMDEVTTPSGSVLKGPILGERSPSADSFDKEVGRYVLAGCFGDLSCSSLYANKQVTAGDGGWVSAREAELGPRLKSLVNHGFDPAFHFLHFETAPNAKINGLGAAFICAQLGENLHNQVEKRHTVATWYRKALKTAKENIRKAVGDKFIENMLKGINEACCQTTFFDAPWVFGIETDTKDRRNALRQFLADHGIESRNYFFPLHLQPVNYFEYKAGVLNSTRTWDVDLPNAARFGATGLYVPSHAFLEEKDVVFIVSVIEQFFIDSTKKVDGRTRERGWVDEARGVLLSGA